MSTSSSNSKYSSAADAYNSAKKQYSGTSGYNLSLAKAQDGANLADQAYGKGLQTSRAQNALANAEAKKYAGEQAQATAAGAQSQATTAARTAGMNKAQAAMMGSQQNAAAYQNAYGNAYNSQMNQANNNASQATSNYANQMNTQQQLMAQMGQANMNAAGNQLSAGQQEGQNEYNRTWGNVAGWTGGLFSDERLKHYKGCSKKVVTKTPSKIQSLKYVKKENE